LFLQRRIVEIHGDVEQITTQRDESITRLKDSLAVVEGENQKFQLQQHQMGKVIKGQKKDLHSLRNAQEEFSNRVHELENELGQKQSEIALLQEQHFREQEETKKKHEQQLHELHEHSTSEIVKFRDDISTSLSAQQKVLSEKHVAELVKAKEDERVEIENEWMAKLVALEEALRYKEEELRVGLLQEKQDEVAQVKEDWGAVLSEQLDAREEQHSLEVKKLTLELTAEQDKQLQLLADSHAQEVAALTNSNANEINRMQEELTALFEKSQEEKLHAAEMQHERHIQEVRAGQFAVLKEAENSYKLEIENLQTTLVLCEEKQQQKLEEVQLGHLSELDELRHQNHLELEEALETYKKELEKMNQNLVAIKIEEKLTLSKKHEEQISVLTKKLETKHKQQLETKLSEVRESHQTYIDQVQMETHKKVEAEWKARFITAEEEHKSALESTLRVQREEMLQEQQRGAEEMLEKAHAHFEDVRRADELLKLSEHQQELELMRETYATEKREMAERQQDALDHLKNSMEESFGKQMEQLTALHEIEMKGRLKERDDRHDVHLATELSALRQNMEEMNANENKSFNQSLAEKHESVTDQLMRKHKEDLTNQEGMLNKAHDSSLQLAVQEVRQLLENLHSNEIQTTKEQHQLKIEQQKTLFDEHLANRVSEVRADCESDKQRCLHIELEALREENRQTCDAMKTQHASELKAVEMAGVEDFSTRLEEMKSELFQQHSQLTDISLEDQRLSLSAQHLDDVERMQREFRDLLRTTREGLEETHREQLVAQEERLQAEASRAADTEHSTFEDTIGALQQEHDARIAEYEEAAHRQSQQHVEEMEDLRSELSSQQASVVQELEVRSGQHLQELRAELEGQMTSSLEAQRRELSSLQESSLSVLEQSLEAHHLSALAQVQQLLGEKEEALEEMKIAMESMKAMHQQNQDHLMSDHTQAKLELTRSHEAKMELLREDYNKFFDESKRNAELAAESVTRNLLHDQQIELLEAQNVKISVVKEELSSEHAQQISSLQSEHVLQMDKAVKNTEVEGQSRANKRLDEAKAQWQLERENAEASLRAHYKDEISLLRVEYNRFLEESKQNVTLASEMAMKNTLQAQRAELLETHAQTVEDLRESLAREHSAKMTALEKSQEEEVSRMRLEHQTNTEEAKKLHEVSTELKIEHALHLQKIEIEDAQKLVMLKMVADLNSESEKQKLEAQSALEELQHEFKKTLEQSQVDAEKEFQVGLAECLQESQARLEEEHARQSATAKEAHDEEVALLRSEYNMFLEENKKNYDTAAQMALESALDEQQKELEATHLAALDVLRSTLVTEHATERGGVMEEHEAYMDAQTKRAEEEYQTRLNDQLTSLKAHLQEEVERAEEEVRQDFSVKLEKELMLAREQAKEEGERDIAERVQAETLRLSREHELAVAAQCDQVRREADERLLAAQVEGEEWKQQYESHKQFFDNEKALNEARVIEANEALEKIHALELAELKESLALESERMRAEHEKQLEELKIRLISAHEQEVAEQISDLEALKDQSELLNQKDAKISQLTEALEELEAHHGDLLAETLRDQMAELVQEHTTALATAQAELDEVTGQLNRDKEMALEQLTSDLHEAAQSEAATLRALEELEGTHAVMLQHQEALLEEKDSEIRTLREDSEVESREAEEELSRLRVEHKHTVDDLARKHSAELVAIKQQYDQSVHQFNQDSDHLRVTSLKSEQQVSETYQRDKAALELEYQTKLNIQLSDLRAKLDAQRTEELSRLESQLEDMKSELKQERATRNSVNNTSESALQTLRDERDLEVRRVRETSRDDLVRMQNTHFDEITSLKIQTQREVSEAQEKLRVMLEEARKRDDMVDSLTQEQHRLLENNSSAKMQLQRELLETQEQLSAAETKVEQKDVTISTMAEEQRQLVENITTLKTQEAVQRAEREDEAQSVSSAEARHSEELRRSSALVEAAEEKTATLQEDLSVLQHRFSDEIQQKEENFAKLSVDYENCIDSLEAKLEAVSHHDSSTQDEVEKLREELNDERNKTAEISAQLVSLSQSQQQAAEGVRESKGDSEDVEALRMELTKVHTELESTLLAHSATVQTLNSRREELLTTVRVLQVEVQDKEQQMTRMSEEQRVLATAEQKAAKEEEEARHVTLLSDLRLAYDQEISQLKGQFQQTLSDQREEMQSRYLALLQKQMANLMGLVHSQDDDGSGNSVPKLEGRYIWHMYIYVYMIC
jgi:hypothetical protein